MNFRTDTWQPFGYTTAQTISALETEMPTRVFRLRHCLVFIAIALVLLALPAWYLFATWAAATLCIGISTLLVVIAAMLLPTTKRMPKGI